MHLVTPADIKAKNDFQKVELPQVEERVQAPAKSSLDVVSQMRANLSQLEELQGRLSFVMGEVRHVIKKSAPRA